MKYNEEKTGRHQEDIDFDIDAAFESGRKLGIQDYDAGVNFALIAVILVLLIGWFAFVLFLVDLL